MLSLAGIVFDPTQSAHAIEQISQGQQIFTNTVKIADNAIAAYNLAYQMSIAPQCFINPICRPRPTGCHSTRQPTPTEFPIAS